MLRQILFSLTLLGVVPTVLPAQVSTSQEARQREIEAQIQRMRELLRQGKLLRSHVRVTVRLKNGNKIRGVVKDGRLIEKVDGLQFVLAEAKAEGAGIRVWYYDDTISYIFLPFEEIEEYKVHERLTSNQIQAIEQKIAEEERRKAELRRLQEGQQQPAQGPTPPGGEPGASGPPPAPGGEVAPPKLSQEEQHLKDLLAEFPPKDGWSAERRREIEMRKVTVGAFPVGKDKRFLEVFDEWQKAYDRFGKEEEPTPGPGSTPPPSEKQGK